MTQDAFMIQSETHRAGMRVYVRGAGTYANTLGYWQAIAAELRKHPPARGGLLLIDETTGPPLTDAEWKTLVEAMHGSGIERVRIAHVKPNGLQRVEFCELYAREAGIDARVFTDEGEADLWLRYGEHNGPV